MPAAIAAIVGIGAFGWAIKETGDAVDSATRLSRWLVAGGAVYVAYRVAQAQGVAK